MYEVECVYPKDITKLQNLLTDVLSDIIVDILTPEELEVYIKKLEETEEQQNQQMLRKRDNFKHISY